MTENDNLAELLAKLEPRLSRILFRYRIPPGDSEDLIESAVMSYVYASSKPQAPRNPEAWIVFSLRNQCLLYHRRHAAASDPRAVANEPISQPQEGSVGRPNRDIAVIGPRLDSSNRLRAAAAVSRTYEIFHVVGLIFPPRIADEELGDALEHIQALARSSAPPWKIYLRTASTLFWLGVNAVREISCACLGKKRI